MDKNISAYLSTIGRTGGKKSRRLLNSDQAKRMVCIREAKRAFKKFHAQCFWHLNPDFKIKEKHIPFLIKGLRLYGGHAGFQYADKLKNIVSV